MGAADAVQSTVLDGILEMFREFEEWCPGVVGHVLEFFVDIPEAKELRLYDLADEYGKLAQQLSDHLERISPSFTAIAENWSGSIGAEQFFQSMQQHMDEVGSSIKAAGSMQEMVQRNAQNIETMKFMAAMDLVMLAWTIYTLIMAAIATFGIAAVGAGPAIAACGAAIKSAGEKLLAQLAKEGVEAVLPATLKKAAEKAAEGVAERAATKAAEVAAGQAAKKAAEEAAAQLAEQVGNKGIGQVLAAPLRSMAGRMAATRAAEEAGGKAARKALVKELVDKGVAKNLAKTVARRETAVAAEAAEEAAVKKFADAGFKDVAGELGSAALRRGEQFALFTFGTEGGVQAWQVATGHRSDFDLSELALHTATGFLTGVVGTPLTLGRAGMAAEVSAMVGGTLAVDAATHPLNNYLAEHSLFGMSPEDKTSWGEWWSQEQGNLAKAASYGAMGGANHLRGELDRHLALVRDDPRPALQPAIAGTSEEPAIRGLVTFPDSAPAGLDVGEHATTGIGSPSDVPAGARDGGTATTAPAASRGGSTSAPSRTEGATLASGRTHPARAQPATPPDGSSHGADTAPSPNGVVEHRPPTDPTTRDAAQGEPTDHSSAEPTELAAQPGRTVPVEARLPDAVRTTPAEPRPFYTDGVGRGPDSIHNVITPESARLQERIASDIGGADRPGPGASLERAPLDDRASSTRQLVDQEARRVDGASARDDSARPAADAGDRSAGDGNQRILPADSAGRDGAGVRVRGPSDADRAAAGDRPDDHAGPADRRSRGLSLRRDGADDLGAAGAEGDLASTGRSAELTGHAGRPAATHDPGNADPRPTPSSHDVAAFTGISMRPEDNADAHRWAEEAYNRFRADDRDIADIADHLQTVPRADGRIGFSAEEIEQVKRHVMVEEHFLGYDKSDFLQRRFSASPDVVEAWIRLREGRFADSDLVLLEHELTEASYLQARPDASFLEAHTYANLRHNWDAREVRRSGEDLDVSWPRSAPDESVSAAQGLDIRGDDGPRLTDRRADPGAGVEDPHYPADGWHGPEHRDPSTSGDVFLQPREPLPLRDLIPRTEAEVAERGDVITHELRRVFAPDQDFGGLHVRLSERTDPISVYRDSVDIRVEMVHPERGYVGHATYSLERDARGLSAKIVNIHLAPDVRGQGFMRDFHSHLERWYAESGPVRVELRATGLGRIVHALTGVAWDPDAGYWSTELGKQLRVERTAAVDDHTVVQRWLDGDHSVDLQAIVDKHGIADPARLASSLERQIGAADAVLEQARRHPFGMPGHPSPWAFVRAGWEDGQRIPDHSWIGRRAMARIGEWRGVKEIEARLDRPSVADVEGGRTDRFTEFADRAWLRAQRDEPPIHAAVDIAVERAGGLAGEDARIGALEHPDAFRDRLASEIAREPGPERVDAVTPTIRYVADLPPERFEHAAQQIVDSLTARGYRPLDDLRAADDAPLRETRWYDGSSGRTFELYLRADESHRTISAGQIEHTRFVPDGRDPTVEGPVEAERFGAAAEGIVPRDFADRSVRDVRWENDLVRVELADGRTQFFRPAVGHGMDSVAETGLRDGTEERPHLVTVNDRVPSDQFTRAWVHEITHARQEHTGTTPETIVRRGLRHLAFLRKPAGTAADDPHVAARVNERRYLERLYETARSRDGRAELRRDIEGLDRDLTNLGYPTEKLPRLAMDEPALRLRSGQPTEPPASKDLPGGQRLHLRGDGRWHLELDEPDSYRGDNGRLYLDRDPPHFYRDDSAHRLHHDLDQPDTFRDERTFHLRDISSGDRVRDPLDDLPVSHRATEGVRVDHAATVAPEAMDDVRQAAAERAAFARDVVQPLIDDLGVTDRLEDLHDTALRKLAIELRRTFAGDAERSARVDDFVRAATDYHEARRDAVSLAEHGVAVDAGRKILAERDIEADATVAGTWQERLPVVGYDHANDRLVVIEPGRVAGTRYTLPDHTITQRGTPEYLRDLLRHDQRLYGAIAERPEVADPLRWAVDRGELTVEYHRLGIAPDGHVWSKSLGTHRLDGTDLATRVPRDSGALDFRARTRVEHSIARVADALDGMGNPGGRKIEILDDATVRMTSGSHARRIELTFTDAVPERYLVDRTRLVVTDEGYRIELDHRAVDRLGWDEVDHMVSRALHRAEAVLKHAPGAETFKRFDDRPTRAGSLVRDPVVPKKLSGRDTFEVAHLRTLLDRLSGATDVEREHLNEAVQGWIEEHGLREGMSGAAERRQLIDPLLSRDAASQLDGLRTIEHAADPAVATVRKALQESTTWNLGVGRSTAEVSAVRLPDRDMFRLSPKDWRAEGRAGVTFQVKSGKPAHGELVGFRVSRLRSHYVLTVDEAIGDMRALEHVYRLRQALSRAMEGIAAEQEKRPPDFLNRRFDAVRRNLPIVSSSGGWSVVELAGHVPFKTSVKTHVTNLFDVVTNNRFQVARRIDAIEALQDLVLSAGLDEIGTHRNLQRAWLDVAWKDVEEMARLAGQGDLAHHLALDLSDPPKPWQPLGEQAQAAFRERFRSDILPALRQAIRTHGIEGVRDVTPERGSGRHLPWRADTDAQVTFTWHKSRASHVAVEVVEFTARSDEVHVDYRPTAIVLQVPQALIEGAARPTLHAALEVALEDIAKRERLLHARDISLADHVRRAYPDIARSLFGAYPIDQVAAGAGQSSAGAAIARAWVGAGVAGLDSRMHIPLDEIHYLADQSSLENMSRLQQQRFGRTMVDIAKTGTRVTDVLLEQATGQHQRPSVELRQAGDLAAARDATSHAVADVVGSTDIKVVEEPADHPELHNTVDAYRLRVGPLNHVNVRFSYADLPDNRDVRLVQVKKGEWLVAVRPDGNPATIRAESARIIDAITFARSHGVLSLRRQLVEGGVGTGTGTASAATILAATHSPAQAAAGLIGAGFRGVRQLFEYRHELAVVDARLATLEGRHELLDVTPAMERDALDTLRGRVESFEEAANGAGEALGRIDPDLATQVENVDGGFGPVPAKWQPLVADVGRLIQEPAGLPPGVRVSAVPDRPHTYQVEFSNNTWRMEFATFEARPGFAGDAGYRHFIVDSDVSNVVVIDPRLAPDDIVGSLRAWLKGEVDGNGGMASGYQTWGIRVLEGARDTAGQVAAGGAAVGVAIITHDPVLTALAAQGGYASGAAMNAATNVLLGARHEGHMRVLGDRFMQHARERGDNASSPHLAQFTGEVTALNNRMWQAYDRMQHYARIAATLPEADRPPDLQRWIDARSGGGGPAPGGGSPRPPDPGPRPAGPGPGPHGPGSSSRGTGPSGVPGVSMTHPVGADWNRIDEQAGGVVAARTAGATGAAAAEMLSHGSVSQDRILRIAGENSSAGAIVTALNAEATGPWRIGPVGPTTFDGLILHGQWIASLTTADGGTHYVVVDGLTDTGLVRVRDPFSGGSSYSVDPDQFKRTWTGESMYRYDPPTSPGDEWTRGVSLSRAAEMLSSAAVEHAAVIDHAGVDADPAAVASAMTDLTGARWIGGSSADISVDLLTRHGPWAAEVIGDGGRPRYVLVEGRTDDGRLLVRDEHGAQLTVDRASFDREWTGQALLPEDPPAQTAAGHTGTTGANGDPGGSQQLARRGLPFGLNWKRVGVGVGLAALGALWYYSETQTAVPPGVPSPGGSPPSGGAPPSGSFPPPVTVPPPGGGAPPTGGNPPPHGPPPSGGHPGGSPPSGGPSHQPPSRHQEPGQPPVPGGAPSCHCGATWPRIHPHAGGAVAELTPGSSGAAAAQMLTHGKVTQAWVLHDVGDGARAAQLAHALDEIWPRAWRGGLVDEQALDILDRHGPWAAEFRGDHDCIHYVVVDGVTPDGMIRIRDPFGQGSTYLMTRAEFLHTWDGVALFHDDPRAHVPVLAPDDDGSSAARHGHPTGRHRID